jgi:radical SAM-linked protein
MSRYVIKFSKEGSIRYISHLDLLRLFKRSFKRVGVRLQYSQGFNPHPKMGFAQPLSLGYFSTGEYLEFDTMEPYPTDEILEKTNFVMPEGIQVLSCNELPIGGKTLAALTEYAVYDITIPLECGMEEDIVDVLENYMAQEQIFVIKHQRKSGKDVKTDIKSMISEISGMVDNNDIMLTTKLSAGSTANLSPEMVLITFCEFLGIQYDRAEILIKRTEILFNN